MRRGLPALALLCLAATAAPAADWPLFHGDARNSGYTPNDAPYDSLLAWVHFAGDSIITSSPVVDEEGNIYIGTLGDDLLALDYLGEPLWAYHGGGNFRHSTPGIGPDGRIYIGGTDGVLHAVEPDGSPAWTYTAGGPIKTAVNFAADGTVYFGSEDGRLYAVSPAGAHLWSYPTGDMVRSSPAVGPDGTIFFGSMDHYFYALWPDGTLRWRALTGDIIKYAAPAVDENGNVYFGSYDGFVYALTSDMGFLWAYPTENAIRSTPCIGPDGRIFVGAGDQLLAINPDGSLDWSESTGGTIYSSPAYFGDDDVILVGSDDGAVYCFREDGSLDWTYTVSRPVRSSPAPGLMGTVIAADVLGRIFCFGDTDPVGVDETWASSAPGWRVWPNPGPAPLTFHARGETVAGAAIDIYDIRGRKVHSLHPGEASSVVWDGRDAEDRPLPSGIYFYRSGEGTRAGRIVLMR